MAKQSIDDEMLDDSLPENVTKRKQNYVLTGEKYLYFPRTLELLFFSLRRSKNKISRVHLGK